jgi:hypothetical protein
MNLVEEEKSWSKAFKKRRILWQQCFSSLECSLKYGLGNRKTSDTQGSDFHSCKCLLTRRLPWISWVFCDIRLVIRLIINIEFDSIDFFFNSLLSTFSSCLKLFSCFERYLTAIQSILSMLRIDGTIGCIYCNARERNFLLRSRPKCTWILFWFLCTKILWLTKSIHFVSFASSLFFNKAFILRQKENFPTLLVWDKTVSTRKQSLQEKTSSQEFTAISSMREKTKGTWNNADTVVIKSIENLGRQVPRTATNLLLKKLQISLMSWKNHDSVVQARVSLSTEVRQTSLFEFF